jgi:hypothetical protein
MPGQRYCSTAAAGSDDGELSRAGADLLDLVGGQYNGGGREVLPNPWDFLLVPGRRTMFGPGLELEAEFA